MLSNKLSGLSLSCARLALSPAFMGDPNRRPA